MVNAEPPAAEDNRVENSSGGKESLLKVTRQAMLSESRIWLFRNLLSRDLATPDVYSFAMKQGKLRDNLKNPDSLTMRRAMRVRLKDTKLTLREEYIQRKKLDKYPFNIPIYSPPWSSCISLDNKELALRVCVFLYLTLSLFRSHQIAMLVVTRLVVDCCHTYVVTMR